MNELTSLPVIVGETRFPIFLLYSAKDPNTIFVSNLLFSINEERLKETFSPVRKNISSTLHHTLSLKKTRFKMHMPSVSYTMLSFDARGNLNSWWKKLNPRNFDQKWLVVVETEWLCPCCTNVWYFAIGLYLHRNVSIVLKDSKIVKR